MMSLYILTIFFVIFICILTGAYTDRQKHKWDSPSSRMLRKKQKLAEEHEQLLREQQAVLITADEKDIRWLLAQYELAGIKVDKRLLAWKRKIGRPPCDCPDSVEEMIETYIRSWE